MLRTSLILSWKSADVTIKVLITCSVRKKWMVRCVDFNFVSSMGGSTVPDRHPLPRAQTTIENVGGNELFSLFDQGKT